jgi:hypothetical protein
MPLLPAGFRHDADTASDSFSLLPRVAAFADFADITPLLPLKIRRRLRFHISLSAELTAIYLLPAETLFEAFASAIAYGWPLRLLFSLANSRHFQRYTYCFGFSRFSIDGWLSLFSLSLITPDIFRRHADATLKDCRHFRGQIASHFRHFGHCQLIDEFLLHAINIFALLHFAMMLP